MKFLNNFPSILFLVVFYIVAVLVNPVNNFLNEYANKAVIGTYQINMLIPFAFLVFLFLWFESKKAATSKEFFASLLILLLMGALFLTSPTFNNDYFFTLCIAQCLDVIIGIFKPKAKTIPKEDGV